MANVPPPFPLPLGHKFGPPGWGGIMIHDGREFRDGQALKLWGNQYRGRIRRPNFKPSERFTGWYQRAVAEVQKLGGFPVTGLLGADEWPLPWTLDSPPGAYIRPGGEHAERQRQQHKANVKDYWRRYSKFDIHPGSDPNAPAWFPGRPFGQFERGPHVEFVQRFFGYPPYNGRFTPRLAQKVRGFQRVNDLPISGVVDARTASLMQAQIDDEDPPPEGGGPSLLVGGATTSGGSPPVPLPLAPRLLSLSPPGA